MKVAIAIGSNLGDRRSHVQWAIDRLTALLGHARASSIIETEPFDVPDAQPPYLNAVVVGETSLEPEALLAVLMDMERECGRQRPSFRAARTLDADIILYGDRVIKTDALELPHPRFREREFVLAPLQEIAADWIDPVTGLDVRELRRRAARP